MTYKAGFQSILIFLSAIFVSISLPSDVVTANSSCDGGDFQSPDWNRTVERQAKVPWAINYNFFNEPMGGAPEPAIAEEDYSSSGWNNNSPEEQWMIWDTGRDLSLLRTDFQTTMLVSEDAIGALKLNLDSQQRTTFCITVESYNESISPEVDVYLLTTNQFDNYVAAYDVAHGAWGWDEDRRDDDRRDDDSLNEIPPEWRSFSVTGWNSFRDSHDYENVKSVSFSVSLDSQEISSSIFGGVQYQHFHLVIDNTNNSRIDDSLPETTVAAYISVVTDERTTILPPWTVSITCCGMILGLFAIPILLNKKYMNHGVSLVNADSQIGSGLVPSLEQEAPEPNIQEESKHL